jgi:hypothetical protein
VAARWKAQQKLGARLEPLVAVNIRHTAGHFRPRTWPASVCRAISPLLSRNEHLMTLRWPDGIDSDAASRIPVASTLRLRPLSRDGGIATLDPSRMTSCKAVAQAVTKVIG